jgi:lysozyme
MAYELIKKSEVLRLKAYLCAAGKPTIGYGTTKYPDGRLVKLGDTCTEAQANEWLNDYMAREVNPRIALLGLKGSCLEAVQSLCYNIGAPAFMKSKLCAAIKRRDLAEIIHQWDFIYAGGKPLLGLARRRTAELALFMSGF